MILLFELGTTVDLFQEKLSQAAIRSLRGTVFESEDALDILESLFRAMTDANPTPLHIGPSVCTMMMKRQKDYVYSAGALIQSLKVCGTARVDVD